MKKFLLSAAILGGFISANAQGPWVEDSVTVGNLYKNRVYYSLENGRVGTTFEDFNKVDFIALAGPYTTSLRVNGGFTSALFHSLTAEVSDWATFDTTGWGNTALWKRVTDDNVNLYGTSAFEAPGVGMGGWGDYNQVTHIVTGTELYIYRTGSGTGSSPYNYKKVLILDKELGVFHIKIANLNGTDEYTASINTNATGKNFVYYSISEDSTYDVEPAANTYDLVFTKFEGLSNGGQGGTPVVSAVSGVINNFTATAGAPGQPPVMNYVSAHKVANTFADDAAFDGSQLSNDFNSVGDKWKALFMTSPTSGYYDVVDSLSYFIKDLEGNIWQLAFTKFYSGTGTSVGKYVFKKRNIAYASIEENNETVGAWNVFPNPAADFVSVVFDSKVSDQATFNLLDLNGRTVMSENFSANTGVNQYSVDLASKNLPAGIYIATLRAGNVLKTTKLIVQ